MHQGQMWEDESWMCVEWHQAKRQDVIRQRINGDNSECCKNNQMNVTFSATIGWENHIKFTLKGFVRMRAVILADGLVEISVEDTGPGIPKGKRGHLFDKFQESLDLLSQGTGIGLCLCKSLVELLQGTISLDDTYDSGVPGSPGARFVVKLENPPLPADSILESSVHNTLQRLM